MAFTRRGNVRLAHRDSKSLIPKHGSGSRSGSKKRMAKATLKQSSPAEEPEEEDSNAKLMREMKNRGVDGTNLRIIERGDE